MSRLRDDGVTIPPVRERRHGLRCRDRRCRSSGSPSSRWPPPRCLRQAAATTEPSRPTRSQRSSPPYATRTPSSSTRAGGCSSRTALHDGSCSSARRTGRRSVHATGFDEPTGLAATRDALYVADFHAGLVRRVDAAKRVTTLARLRAGDRRRGVAVRRGLRGDDERCSRTHLGLGPDRPSPGAGRARPAPRSRVRPRQATSSSPRTRGGSGGSIPRPDEQSSWSTASTRTGSPSPATGPCSSPAAARRAAASAGSRPAGSRPILFDDLHVSDVAVLPDGDLIVTAVEPGAVFRVDPRTGARRKLAG